MSQINGYYFPLSGGSSGGSKSAFVTLEGTEAEPIVINTLENGLYAIKGYLKYNPKQTTRQILSNIGDYLYITLNHGGSDCYIHMLGSESGSNRIFVNMNVITVVAIGTNARFINATIELNKMLPTAPTSDGSYNMNVSNGTVTWAEATGGGSTLYNHCITLFNSDFSAKVTFNLLSTSNTPETIDTITTTLGTLFSSVPEGSMTSYLSIPARGFDANGQLTSVGVMDGTIMVYDYQNNGASFDLADMVDCVMTV